MPGGRPSDYTPELLQQARNYVSSYSDNGEVIPSIAGLAASIGLSRETCHAWARDEENKKEFSDIVRDILIEQEKKLVSGGLSNTYNASITKLLLHKHGYSDKQELEHSGNADKPLVSRVEQVIVDPK